MFAVNVTAEKYGYSLSEHWSGELTEYSINSTIVAGSTDFVGSWFTSRLLEVPIVSKVSDVAFKYW